MLALQTGRCCTSYAAAFDATQQQRILFVGDSKTVPASNSWPISLVANINAVTSPSPVFSGDNVAVGAVGADDVASSIAATLAAQPNNHTIICYNIGVNDFGVATEAAWIADVQAVADAIHTRWPAAVFYVMRPWKAGFDSTADTYAGWIDTIAASRTFIELGPDERVWLKGGDNGATNTMDGIHYSAAGQTACAAAWQTTLGF
jgi:hypothetical protein